MNLNIIHLRTTYWEPYFYVTATRRELDERSVVLNVYYDVQIDFDQLNAFLSSFNSSRQNRYSLVMNNDYQNDIETRYVFMLPCFGGGPIRSSLYPQIGEKLQSEWNSAYKCIYFNYKKNN